MLIIQGIFVCAFCAEMRLRLLDSQYVYANISISTYSTRFYSCMNQKFPACVLYLQPEYGIAKDYEVYNVKFQNETYVNNYNSSTYQCLFLPKTMNITLVNRVHCLPVNDECASNMCTGIPVFKIKWGFSNEYISDIDIDMCRKLTPCSVIFTAPVETKNTYSTIASTSSSTTLSNSKSSTAPIEISDVTTFNNTTSADNMTNTNLIIIITVVFVCVIVCILITICFCKRIYLNNNKNTDVIYANHVLENNVATILNNLDSEKTDANSKDIISTVNENYFHWSTYDEYNSSERYSVINSSDFLNRNNVDNTNENSFSEQQKAYQNVNPFTETSLTKPYARLGKHVKVVEHDYNCLISEREDNQCNIDAVLDSSPTHVTATDFSDH